MRVLYALLLAAGLSACASSPGVHFGEGEQAACAFAQDGCVVMTKRQLSTFYRLAYEAGKAFEKGIEQGKKDAEVFPQPWQEPGFDQREM